MPSIQTPAASADLAQNGSAAGYVQVASNADFYPGAKAWLINDDAGSNQRVLIVSLGSSDKLYLRFILEENARIGFPQPSYGLSDCSAYTTAKHSRICMEAQVVPVVAAFSKVDAVP